jgi:hypothetical protein
MYLVACMFCDGKGCEHCEKGLVEKAEPASDEEVIVVHTIFDIV